jgi:hypothetical protein
LIVVHGKDRRVAGMRHPMSIAPHDAPAFPPPFPTIDVFTAGIEDRPGCIINSLMARLNVGTADRVVAVHVYKDTPDQMLRASTTIKESLHVGPQSYYALLISGRTIIETQIFGKDIG